MYLQGIPEDIFTTTLVKIKYDCDNGQDRCGKEVEIKYKYAKKNFEKNNGKHICRKCQCKFNNPMFKQENVDKIKKTNLEKYGTECSMNIPEHIEKRNKQMFGTEEAKKKIIKKRRKTSEKRYGVSHPMKTKEVQEKQQKVIEDKYGVKFAMQNDECKAKAKRTSMERYGVDHHSKFPEIQAKQRATMMENYGVEYYNQLPEMREYLRENCRIWLKDSWESGGHMVGKKRTKEEKEIASKRVCNAIIDGNWKAGYTSSLKGFCYPSKKCRKERFFYRSSYEPIYSYHLDNNDNVEFYNFECMRVEYEFEDQKLFYVPDFLIKYSNNDYLTIVEIKAEFQRNDPKVLSKNRYLEESIKKDKTEFKILYCNDIKSLNIDYNDLINIGYVKEIKKDI